MVKNSKNETDSSLFVALNYFSHLTLCLSEKIRRCFKSFDIFEKTSDFFHSLAVTYSTTLESGIRGGVNKKNQWNRVGKSRPSMENSIIIIFFSFFKPSLGSSKCIFSFFPHCTNILDKTEVESVQLGNTYIADMDKCPQDKCGLDKCSGDNCNLLCMLVPENWIEVSVLVELSTVRIMTQGDSNLRPLWRDQQP